MDHKGHHDKQSWSRPLPGVVERICFNFLTACDMRCDFCYCPFNGRPPNPEVMKRVVTRCADLGARTITFGGGDPLLSAEFPALAAHALDLGFTVHIDTNGTALGSKHDGLLLRVALLGLPLDGSRPEMHAKMRGSYGTRHFDLICQHLARLSELRINLKVSTIVSAENVADLPLLAALLDRYNLHIWSVYEPWFFDFMPSSALRHGLPPGAFEEVSRSLVAEPHRFSVEINPIRERAGTYFFVGHDGDVYTVAAGSPSRYHSLGPIFEDDIIERWLAIAYTSIRNNVRGRYENACC